jgi:Tol biopolymer transport system component/putative hemolysin
LKQEIKMTKSLILVPVILLLALLAACATATETSLPEATPESLANPASENCIAQGGTLVLEERGDGGQYGVCYFADNQQCEEWALLSGACPVGGVPVTGYVTHAARYCAITGGAYSATADLDSANEQGSCTFADGSTCDAWEYWYATCTPGQAAASTQGLANPASENCAAQGGTLSIAEDGSGGQYGICYFEDNRQCEEWALLRGDCPVGGLKITGYITPAAQYCAIRGGTYEITATGDENSEQGSCTFQDGSFCDAWEFWYGTCTPGQVARPATIQPLSMEICDGQAQAMSHAVGQVLKSDRDLLVVNLSEAPLSDPVTGATGSGCMATVTGSGADFESPDALVTALGEMLQDQGYTEDVLLAGGGPTGLGKGYRNGEQICLVAATWLPDESANCPQDEPISACMLAPEQQNYTITLNCGVENPQAQASVEAAPRSPMGGGSGWLVFDSTRDGAHRDLYGLDTASGAVTRLTQGELDNFAGPWSPDGLRILFTSYGLTNSRIAEINADGSGEQTLSEIDGSDEGFPAWSPDGARIAFTSRRDGNNEIYLMNADGSDPQRLTDAPGDDFAPSWSPDGTQLVFVSDRDNEPGIYDLYLMNADGSNLRRLTSDAANDYSPDWSPDGQWIVYRSHRDGAADIYLIKVDGSALHQLTDDPAEDWAPVWSPDGTLIAFQTNRDGNWEIYTMTVDGSDPLNLTNDPADDQLPFWQP